ncbi:MAG: DNA primase [Spirochaetes bacterium]|nr:DNA primase [Spirochaetota bacterium]
MKFNEAKEYILNNLSIVDIVGSYVKLKKSGNSYKGLCPFHNEKTPSFYVNDQKKIFHCFGCGASGDVISFIQKIERLSFLDSIKKLASILNIEVEFDNDRKLDKTKDEKDLAIKIYSEVKNFYYESLKKCKEAYEYLINRGIDQKTIEFFEIGYAPENQKLFFESILSKFKVDLNFLYKYSIISIPYSLKPFFEKRIIVPIKNLWGDTVAFAGRIIKDENLPKYINSRETPIFQKQNLLFNINNIKNLKEEDNVYLVEGYFDVITASKNGLSYTIAPMGTSLTMNHIKIISRKVDKIFFLFDNDMAGFNAFLRAMLLIIQSDVIVYPYFVKLPDDSKDIDEFFNKGHNYNELLSKVFDGYSIYFSTILDIKNKNRNIEKILKNFFENIKDIDDDIRLRFIFKKISEIDYSLKEDDLYQLFINYRNKGEIFRKRISELQKLSGNNNIEKPNIFEKDLCKFLFFNPQFLQILFDIIEEKHLELLVKNKIALSFIINYNNFIKSIDLYSFDHSKVFSLFFSEENTFINFESKFDKQEDEKVKDISIYEDIKNIIGESLIFDKDKNEENDYNFDIGRNPEEDFIKIIKKFYIKKYSILLKSLRKKIVLIESKIKNESIVISENSDQRKNSINLIEKERDNLLKKFSDLNSKLNKIKNKKYTDIIDFFVEIDYFNFERFFIYFLIKNNYIIENVKEYVGLNDIHYFRNIYSLLLNSLNYEDFFYYLKLEGVEELELYFNLINKNPLFDFEEKKLKKFLLYIKLIKTRKNIKLINEKIDLLNRELKEFNNEINKEESSGKEKYFEKIRVEKDELVNKKNELEIIKQQLLSKLKDLN